MHAYQTKTKLTQEYPDTLLRDLCRPSERALGIDSFIRRTAIEKMHQSNATVIHSSVFISNPLKEAPI